MRIVCLGSGAFALPSFAALAEQHEIPLVVSQPDRPAGRGRRPTPTPVARWASERDLPLFTPSDVNAPEAVERIRSVACDLWLVAAFGQLLSAALLADRLAVNLHASLLPRWRGASPIVHAILAGDAETGVSVITVAQRLDAGPIWLQRRRAILPWQTAGELHDLLAEDGARALVASVKDIVAGAVEPVEQDDARATYAPRVQRTDAWIDFGHGAQRCQRRIHAFSPRPGVAVEIEGLRGPVKLLRAEAVETESQAPAGTLVDPQAGVVVCGEGALRIVEAQPSGRRPMAWSAFAQGRPLRTGALVRSVAPPPPAAPATMEGAAEPSQGASS